MDRHLQPETVKDRVQFLKNLISYYNKEPQKILYPGEDIPKQKLSKRNFNKLKSAYAKDHPKSKPLEYPASQRMTKKLEPLYKHYNINPCNTLTLDTVDS